MTSTQQSRRDPLGGVGKAIQLRRVELGMKRAGLAERAGLSYSYVAEIENGTKRTSTQALCVLAEALGLEPHQLLEAATHLDPTPSPAPTPAPDLADSLARARAVRVAGSGPSSWFHGTRHWPSRAWTRQPGDAEAALELPEVIARLEAALEGVPDERAELALMLALDERRTRRIVREELGRRDLPR